MDDVKDPAWGFMVCLDVAGEAHEQGVDTNLAVALAWAESRFEYPTSSRGAKGPLQVIPGWWCPGRQELGCDLVAAGVLALSTFLEREPTITKAVCAYNGNPGCAWPGGRRFAEAVVRRARVLGTRSAL